VILYDGSYHDVDSSEMAFKIAGSLAFKKGIREAKPILLEPVMNVEVHGPEEFAGDLMGDFKQPARPRSGHGSAGHTTIIKARFHLAEMLSSASDYRPRPVPAEATRWSSATTTRYRDTLRQGHCTREGGCGGRRGRGGIELL